MKQMIIKCTSGETWTTTNWWLEGDTINQINENIYQQLINGKKSVDRWVPGACWTYTLKED